MPVHHPPGNHGWHMRTFNLSRLVKQAGCSQKRSKGGAITIVDIYCGGEGVCRSAIPFINDYSPQSRTIVVTDYELLLEEGGQARLTITYQGALPDHIGIQYPTYELELSATSEPIATHPDFETILGGKLGAELNDAQFDAEGGIFKGFPPGATNNMGGITEYYCPSAHFKVHYTSFQRPGLGGVAKRSNPPIETGVDESRQNWLKNGVTYVLKGGAYEVTETWLLSALGKWNPLVYPA